MPARSARTTLIQRLLSVGAALSLVAALGSTAGAVRATDPLSITVIDINETGSSAALDDMDYGSVAFKGSLYFGADDGSNGAELWMSDGTVAGSRSGMKPSSWPTVPS